MLRDRIVQVLTQRYPTAEFEILATAQPFARLDSGNSDMGTLEIYDDGDEATLSISEITHGHFNEYDAASASEREQSIVDGLVYFLDALFADRVLLFRTPDRGQGGWRVFDDRIDKHAAVQESEGFDHFVWSGPVGAGG